MRALTGTVAWRLVLWFLILSTLPIAVMAVFVRHNVSDAFVDLVSGDAAHEARLIAAALGAAKDESYERDVLSLASDGSQSVMHFEASGQLTYWQDGQALDVGEEGGISIPVPGDVLKAGAGSFVDESSLRVFAHAPVPGSDEAIVLVTEPDLVRLPMAVIERTSVTQLALSLIVVAAAGGIVIWIIIGPIHRLTEAAEAIGEGNLDVRIDADEMEGELLVLTRSFNRMADQLQASYALLEQQVVDRTRDLAILNRTASAAGRSLESDAILQDALATVLGQLGYEAGAICLADDSATGVRLAQSQGFPEALCGIAPWSDIVSSVVKSGHPSVSTIGHGGPGVPEPAVDLGFRVVVVVPLVAQLVVEGVLITATATDRQVTDSELELLVSVGHQIGVSVQNESLHGQARRLAVLEERQRLARDLHDSVTQSLYGVTLYAEAAARLVQAGDLDTCVEHLGQTRDAARSALREMRLLIYELRPADLEDVGIAQALRARLELVEGRSGVGTTVEIDDDVNVAPETEEEIYRVAQEALNNALKHAHARSVRVELRHDAGTQSVWLRVSDDGVGMDLVEARAHAGLGLSSMAERAARIGGTLSIDSVPGSGTVVSLEVPL